MRKLIILGILTLLLVGSVYGWEWDNTKEFIPDGQYGKIKVTNALGLGKDLAEYTLEKNTDVCLSDCFSEGTATLYEKDRLFSGINFKDKSKKDTEIKDSKILILETEIEYNEVDDYGEVCGILNNGTLSCPVEKIGSHIETRERNLWVEYEGEKLEPGTYKWRIEGKKSIGQTVDMIPSGLGVEFNEWVWWNTTFSFRRVITLTNPNTLQDAISNYTVSTLLDTATLISAGKMNADCSDLNVVYLDTVSLTEQNRTFVERCDNANSEVYFTLQIPLNASTTTSNYSFYYGNSNADILYGSEFAFIFFDSAEFGSLTDKWTQLSGTNSNYNTTTVFQGSKSLLVSKVGTAVNQQIFTDLSPRRNLIYELWYNDDLNFNSGVNHGFLFRNNSANIHNYGVSTANFPRSYALFDSTGWNNSTFVRESGWQKLAVGIQSNRSSQIFLDNNVVSGLLQVADINADRVMIFNEDSVGNDLLFVDNIRVREYIFPEPNSSVAGEQAQGIGLVVDLISPEDNTESQSTSIGFNGTFSVDSGNLTNATLYTWFANGTLFKTNFTSLTVGTANSTNLTISGFTVGLDFDWNYFVCAENTTSVECSFATSNFTFTSAAFIENSQTFTAETTEGNTETFILNITISSGAQVATAELFYNDTRYEGTKEDIAGDTILTRTITAPAVNAKTNFTFVWRVTLNNGADKNSTSQNQTVNNIGIDDCSANNITILNYTLRDEETQDILVAATVNSSVEIDVDIFSFGKTGSTIINFSGNFSEVNPIVICLEDTVINGTQYSMDVLTRYDADGYVAEFHNIQNFTLNNNTIPQIINLFDLKSTDSTKFLITFKSSNFAPVEDAIIDITRRYVSDGVFKSVEIPKTDTNGKTIGHFDLNNVVYTLIVSKNGRILAAFDNVAVVCEDEIIGDCNINLNALSTSIPFDAWDSVGGFEYTLTFDEDTRTITSIFTNVGGASSTVNLTTWKFDMFGNNTVCSDQLISSSGTLTCTVPSAVGNISIISKLFNNNELITQVTFQINPSSADRFGATGIILLLMLVITLPLMFITSTIGMIIGSFMGFIIAGLLQVYNGGSLIGTGGAFIWIIVAGGIIIWKIARRE